MDDTSLPWAVLDDAPDRDEIVPGPLCRGGVWRGITGGILVDFLCVYAVLASDDSVEIIYLELDRSGTH